MAVRKVAEDTLIRNVITGETFRVYKVYSTFSDSSHRTYFDVHSVRWPEDRFTYTEDEIMRGLSDSGDLEIAVE